MALAVLTTLLWPAGAQAGKHFYAQGPEYEVMLNDRRIPQIPLAMDRDDLRSVENVFCAWVLGGNQAYARVQETQSREGYVWFLCEARPRGEIAEFVWPPDQQLIAQFEDGTSLAAVEIITHTSATWGRAPQAVLLPIYPRGTRILFCDFVSTYPSGSSNTILAAFPGEKWGKLDRVILERDGEELTRVMAQDE